MVGCPPSRRVFVKARPSSKRAPQNAAFDVRAFLGSAGLSGKVGKFQANETIFSQGDPANSVMFIEEGGVKLTVVSESGKQAVVGVLEAGDFFGEGCLAGQSVCLDTASAIAPTTTLIIGKTEMIRLLHQNHQFSECFIAYMLIRNIRVEEDLIDQLFNSSEKRLARTLLLLAHYGARGAPQKTIPNLSQEVLAETIGTTRPRVNFFMNKFRKLGYIEYDKEEIHVNSSLLSIILHD